MRNKISLETLHNVYCTMKKMKLFAIILGLTALSIVGSINAQPGHYGGGRPGGFQTGGGHPGGYGGGGNYGGFNHYGYAAAPYRGVATGPIGHVGFSVGYGGPGYGGGGYGYGGGYNNGRCSWDYYWHQWRCW